MHAIVTFVLAVKESLDNELCAVHWGQTKQFWGFMHILNRYVFLGKTVGFYHPDGLREAFTSQYGIGRIDLANFLVTKYGNNYVPHPRLDNLATLNNFTGLYESDPINSAFYGSHRLRLLVKIYSAILNDDLKIGEISSKSTDQVIKAVKSDKQFSAYEWAAIFYYAFKYKDLPNSRSKIASINFFLETHDNPTTKNSIKNDEIAFSKILSSSVKLTIQ